MRAGPIGRTGPLKGFRKTASLDAGDFRLGGIAPTFGSHSGRAQVEVQRVMSEVREQRDLGQRRAAGRNVLDLDVNGVGFARIIRRTGPVSRATNALQGIARRDKLTSSSRDELVH